MDRPMHRFSQTVNQLRGVGKGKILVLADQLTQIYLEDL